LLNQETSFVGVQVQLIADEKVGAIFSIQKSFLLGIIMLLNNWMEKSFHESAR